MEELKKVSEKLLGPLKLAIIFSLLFASSCWSPQYITTPTGKIKRMCDIPVFYVYDASVSSEYKKAISKGVNYWNKVLEKEMFIDGNVELGKEYASGSVLVFSEVPSLGTDCGMAVMHHKKLTGCATDLHVVLNNRCMKSSDIIQTLVRHEIGHILGLDNSDNPWHLMTSAVLENHKKWTLAPSGPVDATESEIKALKEIY